MRFLSPRCLVPGAWLLLSLLSLSAADYRPVAPQGEVEVIYKEFLDADRDRTVPVKLFVPERGAKPSPVILWSHGLGGSRNGLDYLGEFLAEHGYLAVHLQHPGSDSALWKAQNSLLELRKAIEGNVSIQNFMDRVEDVSFVLDELTQLNRQDGALQGTMDLRKVGMSGHSFGAITTQATVGQQFRGPGGETQSFREKRISAGLVMSPSPPVNGQDPKRSFAPVDLPMMHFTGTADSSPFDWFPPQDRRLPYDFMNDSRQYLLIFKDADHVVFSGHKRRLDPEEARVQATVKSVSLAFWDAHLKGRSEALRWLQSKAGGVTSLLELGDVWETKD